MGNKYKAHIAFVLLMLVYFLIRYLRIIAPNLPDFLRFYFTDLLFVPAMSLFALIIIRFMKRDESITIHWLTVLIQVVVVSIYFEWYLPNHTTKDHIHVSDWLDCAMYATGGWAFVLTQPYLTTKNFGQKKTEPDHGFRNVKDKNV